MKGIDIFCASQAATAIRQIMDEGSSSSSTATIHLGRAIDRHNPIIRDATRTGKPPLPRLPPCSSQPPPATPKPYNHHRKTSTRKTTTSSKPNKDHHNHRTVKKSSSSSSSTTSKPSDDQKRKGVCDEASDGTVIKKSWSCTKPGDFITPPSSSRYLLSDKPFLDVLSDFDPILTLVPVEPSKSQALKKDDQSSASIPPSSSRSPDQVVVLRVSLHCKGCEKKMRKHISRMEGVTSFNIDFAAKKVTVVGDVTPLSVLASVSKVKNAQLLTPTISSSLPTAPSSCPEINKYNGVSV